MSAYRRINRSSKSTTFQHPSLSAFQHQQHCNNHTIADASNNGNGHYGDGGNAAGGGNNIGLTNGNDDRQLSNGSGCPTQPKHLRFPDASLQSELLNELIMFAFAVLATAMQFLHLYRTVWWLPESHTSQSMVIIIGQCVTGAARKYTTVLSDISFISRTSISSTHIWPHSLLFYWVEDSCTVRL